MWERGKTYESRPVGTEPAHELLPGSTGVGEDNDAAHVVPGTLHLFPAYSPALVGT